MGLAEWFYNTSYHTAIKQTHFEDVYGRTPPTLANYIPGTTQIKALDVSLQTRDEKLQTLKRTLEAAQQKMNAQADMHRTDFSFQVGDLVLFKQQPYRQ